MKHLVYCSSTSMHKARREVTFILMRNAYGLQCSLYQNHVWDHWRLLEIVE